jgi:acyl carrier protein
MSMSAIRSGASIGKVEIYEGVIAILEHITSDWDQDFAGGIRPESRLVADLGFESIDVVQFVSALEDRFRRTDLPFERLLMVDGRYVGDLSVASVVDFLDTQLNTQRS